MNDHFPPGRKAHLRRVEYRDTKEWKSVVPCAERDAWHSLAIDLAELFIVHKAIEVILSTEREQLYLSTSCELITVSQMGVK